MPGEDAAWRSPQGRDPSRWGAVVLSGGAGVRLGGADKAAIAVDGLSMLERALAALADAAETIVVGPQAPTSRPVLFSREHPVGSGPATALLHGAGLVRPRCDVVVALAVDMPRVTRHTVARLLAALAGATGGATGGETGADAALLHDGRQQPLCAAYRTTSLLRVAPASPSGTSMRALVDRLRLVEVAAIGDEAADVDHWSDLDRLRPS